jgi:hypothetical protein
VKRRKTLSSLTLLEMRGENIRENKFIHKRRGLATVLAKYKYFEVLFTIF